jgi:hypothetical protein
LKISFLLSDSFAITPSFSSSPPLCQNWRKKENSYGIKIGFLGNRHHPNILAVFDYRPEKVKQIKILRKYKKGMILLRLSLQSKGSFIFFSLPR